MTGPYNDFTFRRLTYAVIRILALNFTVEEIDTPRRATSGPLVKLQDLLSWEPCNEDIIRVGGVSMVVSQHIPHALNLAKDDFGRWVVRHLKQHAGWTSKDTRTYLLFSRQHVFLYQINRDIERCTRPECLLDDTSNFSSAAISLLLEATQQPFPGEFNQCIPVEIQNMILENAAVGPIQRAKLGCVFNIISSSSSGRPSTKIGHIAVTRYSPKPTIVS